MSSMKKYSPNELFYNGIDTFNKQQFYNAHEILEELWSEHQLNDRVFIQGLIQVSVAFYHLQNNNLNGSRSMLKKALKKINYNSDRISNLSEIIEQLKSILEKINLIETNKEFDWSLIPAISINKDEK